MQVHEWFFSQQGMGHGLLIIQRLLDTTGQCVVCLHNIHLDTACIGHSPRYGNDHMVRSVLDVSHFTRRKMHVVSAKALR